MIGKIAVRRIAFRRLASGLLLVRSASSLAAALAAVRRASIGCVFFGSALTMSNTNDDTFVLAMSFFNAVSSVLLGSFSCRAGRRPLRRLRARRGPAIS